jgi:hypothetical protein
MSSCAGSRLCSKNLPGWTLSPASRCQGCVYDQLKDSMVGRFGAWV